MSLRGSQINNGEAKPNLDTKRNVNSVEWEMQQNIWETAQTNQGMTVIFYASLLNILLHQVADEYYIDKGTVYFNYKLSYCKYYYHLK